MEQFRGLRRAGKKIEWQGSEHGGFLSGRDDCDAGKAAGGRPHCHKSGGIRVGGDGYGGRDTNATGDFAGKRNGRTIEFFEATGIEEDGVRADSLLCAGEKARAHSMPSSGLPGTTRQAYMGEALFGVFRAGDIRLLFATNSTFADFERGGKREDPGRREGMEKAFSGARVKESSPRGQIACFQHVPKVHPGVFIFSKPEN